MYSSRVAPTLELFSPAPGEKFGWLSPMTTSYFILSTVDAHAKNCGTPRVGTQVLSVEILNVSFMIVLNHVLSYVGK